MMWVLLAEVYVRNCAKLQVRRGEGDRCMASHPMLQHALKCSVKSAITCMQRLSAPSMHNYVAYDDMHLFCYDRSLKALPVLPLSGLPYTPCRVLFDLQLPVISRLFIHVLHVSWARHALTAPLSRHSRQAGSAVDTVEATAR